MTLYAVFGGADFGAGFWTLVAGGGERGRRARALIDWAIGPVWESNHVWLIFVLVVLWTAFSEAFASIMSTLFIPLSLAALGIVLRGAGFAFHGVAGTRLGTALRHGAFALSSVLTPFFMGTVAGAVASGRVPIGNAEGRSGHELAQSGLPADRRPVRGHRGVSRRGVPRRRRPPLRRSRPRALFQRPGRSARRSGAGIVAVAGIFVLRADARYIYDGLVSEGLPLVLVSARVRHCGPRAALARRPGAACARSRSGAVVAVIWGWGAAQYPYLLPTTLKIEDAAAASETLTALLVVFGVAVVVVFPALGLLYTLDQRSLLEEDGRAVIAPSGGQIEIAHAGPASRRRGGGRRAPGVLGRRPRACSTATGPTR